MIGRTRLRNKFLKNQSPENTFAYNQDRTFCVSLMRKIKLEYVNNMIQKKIFWNKIKPFFSDNRATSVKYTLIDIMRL